MRVTTKASLPFSRCASINRLLINVVERQCLEVTKVSITNCSPYVRLLFGNLKLYNSGCLIFIAPLVPSSALREGVVLRCFIDDGSHSPLNYGKVVMSIVISKLETI